MIRACTWDEVRAKRRSNDKATFRGFITDFIVPEPGDQIRPQSYLVEQSPDWVLPVHFHLEHQFQVFTAGSGALGTHPVEPLCIHYASPESGYGPLKSGAEGLSYFTLRVVSDEGAWYLPESRARMQRGIAKQQEQGKPRTYLSDDEVRNLGAPMIDTMLSPQETGLAAYVVRIPSKEVVPATSFARSGDRFYVVTKGSMVLGEKSVAGLATIFASRDEEIDIRSGSAGLEVVVLQFPDNARSEMAQAEMTSPMTK